MEKNERDFSSISPSAKSLLLMKGHTDIPFARQTAELIDAPKKFIPNFDNHDLTFWARTLHFESRYKSIDMLLKDLRAKNILELSSGFSLRGLDVVKKNNVYYIDTDLPDIIETKEKIFSQLNTVNDNIQGTLELLPLNALDEKQFRETIERFPQGEIVILNEGLLMYLNDSEKETLCKNIYSILKERGGYWITADVNIKTQFEKMNLKLDSKTVKFFEQHKIEENKFDSFNDAEIFFNRMGFSIDKEAKIKHSQLSSFKYFLKSVTLKDLFNFRKRGKFQATWRLKIKTH